MERGLGKVRDITTKVSREREQIYWFAREKSTERMKYWEDKCGLNSIKKREWDLEGSKEVGWGGVSSAWRRTNILGRRVEGRWANVGSPTLRLENTSKEHNSRPEMINVTLFGNLGPTGEVQRGKTTTILRRGSRLGQMVRESRNYRYAPFDRCRSKVESWVWWSGRSTHKKWTICRIDQLLSRKAKNWKSKEETVKPTFFESIEKLEIWLLSQRKKKTLSGRQRAVNFGGGNN